MNRSFSFFAFIFTFYIAGTMAVTGQSVSGSITKGTVERGGTARGSISLTIPGGLHVNSSKPASEYAIPTVVKVSGSGVRVNGLTYPRGTNRKFQFSENLINVYEGRVSFPFRVTVPASFRGETIRLTASVRYQACTEEVCYPPKTKSITFTAKVR